MMETWRLADISTGPGWAADPGVVEASSQVQPATSARSADPGVAETSYHEALAGISAQTIVMPSTTDCYFTMADSEIEASLIPGAVLMPLVSDLGHIAGRPGIRSAETEQIKAAVDQLI
jgi:homoserine O-acetyltransferase